MHKITNVDTLGDIYTVVNKTGQIMKRMRIIPYEDIQDVIPEVQDEVFGNNEAIESYIKEASASLTRDVNIDLEKIYWHTTSEHEIMLSAIIEYAFVNGYDKIVLEHIDNE